MALRPRPAARGTGRQPAATKIYANPRPGIHSSLLVGGPRFDSERAAPERENTHDAGFIASE
eukprot:5077169-Pleurochrysis_carterae.AAC.1